MAPKANIAADTTRNWWDLSMRLPYSPIYQAYARVPTGAALRNPSMSEWRYGHAIEELAFPIKTSCFALARVALTHLGVSRFPSEHSNSRTSRTNTIPRLPVGSTNRCFTCERNLLTATAKTLSISRIRRLSTTTLECDGWPHLHPSWAAPINPRSPASRDSSNTVTWA